MPHPCRLLATGAAPAAFNMGLDEALLEAVASGASLPVVRLYAWKPAAVSVGYFQGAREEVDVEACAARGVDLVRRITGGGAVFHQAEITYSLAFPEAHPLVARVILDSYRRFCAPVVEGLRSFGVEADFAPINDVVARCPDGALRKVSGNAQTRKLGCVLQHGTILLDLDVDLMFDLLKVPSEKAKGKAIADVKARVAGLRSLLGRDLPYAEAEAAFAEAFRSTLDLEWAGDSDPSGREPSGSELERAGALAREKFGAEAWTFKR